MRFPAFFILILLLAPATARAHSYVWQDPKFDYAVSFPDDWARNFTDVAGPRLEILAPTGDGHVFCKFFAREDGRFAHLPGSFLPPVVEREFGRDFWQNRLAAFNNTTLYDIQTGKALGQGWAVWTHADYLRPTPGPDGEMTPYRAWMGGTIYYNMSLDFRCAAPRAVYERWAPEFQSIVSSIAFAPRYTALPEGDYRPFVTDPNAALHIRTRAGRVLQY